MDSLPLPALLGNGHEPRIVTHLCRRLQERNRKLLCRSNGLPAGTAAVEPVGALNPSKSQGESGAVSTIILPALALRWHRLYRLPAVSNRGRGHNPGRHAGWGNGGSTDTISISV